MELTKPRGPSRPIKAARCAPRPLHRTSGSFRNQVERNQLQHNHRPLCASYDPDRLGHPCWSSPLNTDVPSIITSFRGRSGLLPWTCALNRTPQRTVDRTKSTRVDYFSPILRDSFVDFFSQGVITISFYTVVGRRNLTQPISILKSDAPKPK